MKKCCIGTRLILNFDKTDTMNFVANSKLITNADKHPWSVNAGSKTGSSVFKYVLL